jgi:hypothetical protein
MASANPSQFPRALKKTGRTGKIRSPRPDERGSTAAAREWLPLTVALVMVTALVLVCGFCLFRSARFNGEPIEKPAVSVLAERIIAIESHGDQNLRNKRSSATGAGQFLDDTWLEAVRKHRRDLLQGRSEKEVLELRRDAELAREIVSRLVEQYATMLSKRGLPITPGSLYLTYFAGPAGAMALLSGAETADAASLMASADATGRTTREKLVSANPFLKVLTVGDLKNWADHKMRTN